MSLNARRLAAAVTASIALTMVTLAACASHRSSSIAARPVATSATQEAPTHGVASTAAQSSTPLTAGGPTTHLAPTTGTTAPRPVAPRPTTNGLMVRRENNGVWVVDIDSKMLRFNLMPGSVEPQGSYIRPSSLTAAFRATVIAAFNGGFKFKDSDGGFYLGGIAAVPLVDGAASLVISRDGTASVGQWNRDFRMGPEVEAVLQNLRLMVDHGAPSGVSSTDTHVWGSTFPKETTALVPRSGICVTAGRRIRWVGGPGIGPATLADTMVAAGCARGMELDINPKWVSFAIYDHPDPVHPSILRGHNLYDGMRFPPDTYFAGKQRNWLMLTRRFP